MLLAERSTLRGAQGGPALMPAFGIVVVADQGSFPSTPFDSNSYILGNYQTPERCHWRAQSRSIWKLAFWWSNWNEFKLILLILFALSSTFIAISSVIFTVLCTSVTRRSSLRAPLSWHFSNSPGRRRTTLALTKFLQAWCREGPCKSCTLCFELACTSCFPLLAGSCRTTYITCPLWFLSSSRWRLWCSYGVVEWLQSQLLCMVDTSWEDFYFCCVQSSLEVLRRMQ